MIEPGRFKFNNGNEVRTQIAGFEGIIESRRDYLFSTPSYLIAPPVNEEGLPREAFWYEEGDIILVKANAIQNLSKSVFNFGHIKKNE